MNSTLIRTRPRAKLSLDWWAVIIALVFVLGVKFGAIISIPW